MNAAHINSAEALLLLTSWARMALVVQFGRLRQQAAAAVAAVGTVIGQASDR